MVGHLPLKESILVRVQVPQHFGKLSAGLHMANKYYIYILLCDQKTYYVGITNNIRRRIQEHRQKKSLFTKKFSDIHITYCECYSNENEAVLREKQLKGWSRAKKELLIKGTLGINRIELDEVLD